MHKCLLRANPTFSNEKISMNACIHLAFVIELGKRLWGYHIWEFEMKGFTKVIFYKGVILKLRRVIYNILNNNGVAKSWT